MAKKIMITSMFFGSLLCALGMRWVREAQLPSEWQQMQVLAPASRPLPSQASIETALALYGIKVPGSATTPQYVPTLNDRGATIRSTRSSQLRVEIGPAAFESWAILGSTLAHELEVHCQQNFLFINILDLLGLDGTSLAERSAYEYEIEHAERFGLTHYDRLVIGSTMDYYFPSPKQTKRENLAKISGNFTTWLAKTIVH